MAKNRGIEKSETKEERVFNEREEGCVGMTLGVSQEVEETNFEPPSAPWTRAGSIGVIDTGLHRPAQEAESLYFASSKQLPRMKQAALSSLLVSPHYCTNTNFPGRQKLVHSMEDKAQRP